MTTVMSCQPRACERGGIQARRELSQQSCDRRQSAWMPPRSQARGWHDTGFTLIEILVVIVLISIVSGIALVTITSNQKKDLETFAKKLTRIITYSEQYAILKQQTLGLKFQENTWQFYEYRLDLDEKKPWRIITEGALKSQTIPHHIRIHFISSHENAGDKPHIIISESGDLTPFQITIAHEDHTPDYMVIGEANGEIRVEEYHAPSP